MPSLKKSMISIFFSSSSSKKKSISISGPILSSELSEDQQKHMKKNITLLKTCNQAIVKELSKDTDNSILFEDLTKLINKIVNQIDNGTNFDFSLSRSLVTRIASIEKQEDKSPVLQKIYDIYYEPFFPQTRLEKHKITLKDWGDENTYSTNLNKIKDEISESDFKQAFLNKLNKLSQIVCPTLTPNQTTYSARCS